MNLFVYLLNNGDEFSNRINHQNLLDENFFTDANLYLIIIIINIGNYYYYIYYNSAFIFLYYNIFVIVIIISINDREKIKARINYY